MATIGQIKSPVLLTHGRDCNIRSINEYMQLCNHEHYHHSHSHSRSCGSDSRQRIHAPDGCEGNSGIQKTFELKLSIRESDQKIKRKQLFDKLNRMPGETVIEIQIEGTLASEKLLAMEASSGSSVSSCRNASRGCRGSVFDSDASGGSSLNNIVVLRLRPTVREFLECLGDSSDVSQLPYQTNLYRTHLPTAALDTHGPRFAPFPSIPSSLSSSSPSPSPSDLSGGSPVNLNPLTGNTAYASNHQAVTYRDEIDSSGSEIDSSGSKASEAAVSMQDRGVSTAEGSESSSKKQDLVSIVDSFYVLTALTFFEICLDVLHLFLAILTLTLPWRGYEMLVAIFERSERSAGRIGTHCWTTMSNAEEMLLEYRSELAPILNTMAKTVLEKVYTTHGAAHEKIGSYDGQTGTRASSAGGIGGADGAGGMAPNGTVPSTIAPSTVADISKA